MITSPESLKLQWAQIDPIQDAFQKLDTKHPLDWFIGYSTHGNKTLMFLTDIEINNINSSKSIEVIIGKRSSDNKYTLCFELMLDEQFDVFTVLCSDIIEYSRKYENASDSIKAVVKRFKRWDKLLEKQSKGMLDESSRRGLIGELLFLRKLIHDGLSPADAVSCWTGPEGTDQDFILTDYWYEVKTIQVSADTAQISSLEQLDSKNNGELVIVRLDKSSPLQRGAFTLNSLVADTANLFENGSTTYDSFFDKLNEYGYISLAQYDEKSYFSPCIENYIVDETFPRITRNTIANQIISVKYTLSITAIQTWKQG